MPISERRFKAARITSAALGLVFLGWLWWPAAPEYNPQFHDQESAGVVQEEPRPSKNEPDVRLTARLRRVVQAAISEAVGAGAKRGSSHVSVVVKELGADGDLVDLDGDKSLRPASNLKLATTAAALTLLGAGATFDTHFDAQSEPARGVLDGDLIVRAGADPIFMESAGGRVDSLMEPWIKALRGAGVNQVNGDVILDLGSFPDPAVTPGWPDAGQHWQEYCALSSGFTANGGCMTVKVEAGRAGGPAKVSVSPICEGMALDLAVATTARRSSLTVSAVVGDGKVRVRGNIPADVTSYTKRFAHPDPVELFGGVLLSALRDGGVAVMGGIQRRRNVPASIRLASMSHPVVDVLLPINRDSNNAVADQLFLKLGFDVTSDGSRAGGERAVLTALDRLGVDSAAWRQVEGSGLSRDNRVSSRQLVVLLDSVLSGEGEAADAYSQSLAVAGESGTLAARMVDSAARGRVIAKTGFIGGTSALSGLARGESGRVYVFSVLVNYPTLGGLNSRVWKPMQDSICNEIVTNG